MIDLLKVEKAIIQNVTREYDEAKTLTLKLEEMLDFKQGQFILLSKLGAGESPFAISSNPNNSSTIEVTVQKLGKNTSALHQLDEGEEVFFRGPYGTCFPVDKWKGKKVIVIGGGIGMAPLRSLIYSLIENLQDYKKVELLYGIRSYDKMLYKDELNKIKEKISVNIIAEQNDSLQKRSGLVTYLIKEMQIEAEECIVVICGPEKMIKACINEVSDKGIQYNQIFVSLEMKMKCGIGICGRCNIDHRYICSDGPVFRLDEVQEVFF